MTVRNLKLEVDIGRGGSETVPEHVDGDTSSLHFPVHDASIEFLALMAADDKLT